VGDLGFEGVCSVSKNMNLYDGLINFSAMFLSVLLVLFVVILMQNTQIFKNNQKKSDFTLAATKKSVKNFFSSKNTQKISFYIIVKDHPQYCRFQWRNYQFTISSCESLQRGAIVQIVGRDGQNSASDFLSRKKLVIQSILPISEIPLSDQLNFTLFLQCCERFLIQIYAAKGYFEELVEKIPSIQTRSLASAMVLGDKSELPEEVYHIFEVTGMLHVLAVSGMHVGILQRLVKRLISRFWRPWRFFTQVVILVSYASLIGFSASVIRATVLMILALTETELLLRPVSALRNLGYTVILMLLVNWYALFQVGFQLSVLATATILIWLQIRKRWFLTKRSAENTQATVEWLDLLADLPSSSYSQPHASADLQPSGKDNQVWVRRQLKAVLRYGQETLWVSLLIQVVLAPLLWWHFGSVSWVGVGAGPATLWLVPPLFTAFLIYLLISSSAAFFSSISGPGFFLLAVLFKFSQHLLEVLVTGLAGSFILLIERISSLTEPIALISVSSISLPQVVWWYGGWLGVVAIELKRRQIELQRRQLVKKGQSRRAQF